MDIQRCTKAYEQWLGKAIPLVQADLQLKHTRMTESAFAFLRATFYRWVQVWPTVCGELARAPVVLGVGDLHIENFGTWRDAEGRLIWGINDFDEAWPIPYTNDLVRLATSAQLAIAANHLSCDVADGCDAILRGYEAGLEAGGTPFVLAEEHRGLREWANSELREPATFWGKLQSLPASRTGVPTQVKKALQEALPERGVRVKIVHRQAGLGSLGRRRFVALAQWCGGWVAREAKELASSAWGWERPGKTTTALLYQQIANQAVRVPDPFLKVQNRWLLRRLAPDCSRIEIEALPKTRDELKLLHAMGRETANVHLGTSGAVSRMLADLKKRPARWLRKAADAMTTATLSDWKEWVESCRRSGKSVL